MIFSSSGELELVETPPLGPSGEDVGGGDEAHEDTLSEQHFGVFKDFDFLDVELEEAEVRNGNLSCSFQLLSNYQFLICCLLFFFNCFILFTLF